MRLRDRAALTACLAALGFGAAGLLAADRVPASAHLQLAERLYAEARLPEALESYRQAVESDLPEVRLTATSGIVRTLIRMADFRQAQEAAANLETLAPDDPAAIALYGDALWSAGLFDEAEASYERALALDPNQAVARRGHAQALAARNQLDAALEEALMAQRLAPLEPEYHHTVGFIYERLHRFDDAAAAYGEYVTRLPPNDRTDKAAWARSQIRFLRSFRNRVPLEMVESATDRHTVPFRLRGDKVMVRGRINGGRELEFVLDTGSEMTMVSRQTAERLDILPVAYTLSAGVGSVGLRGLQIGRLDELEFGSLALRNVPVLIKNPELGDLPTREGEGFSPLALGLSMSVDYGRRELTIGRDLPVTPNADLELPLRLHRLALVRGTLDGERSASFVVDTGGEVISISTATASALDRAQQVRRIPLKVYGTSGWDPEAFLLPGVNLAFDTLSMPNQALVVLNLRTPSALLGFQVGGIVGHRFLSRYRVDFDLQRSVLRLTAL